MLIMMALFWHIYW